MNFPVWDVGFGLPLLIALVAIPHVFVSHFAIGGGIFLLVYEKRAREAGDSAMLEYVRLHSRFFMLLTLVFGALTGVGIWFTIGLIHPAATSSLIHFFVWFWAIEWVMFFVEIAASLVYYYGRDRLDGRTHTKVMWIYVIAAWGSLAVINAIITFMLSSGTWPQDRNIWGAILNPTYFPSLITRTVICTMLAGLYAFVTSAWVKDAALRLRINRIAALWAVGSLLLLLVCFRWYEAALPEGVKQIIAGDWTALHKASQILPYGIIAIVAGSLAIWLTKSQPVVKTLSILTLSGGMLIFGAFEWYREAARKPFVISNYMYSNGMLVSDTIAIKEKGYLATIKWQHSDPARKGEDIFRAACASCHSLSGYNGLACKIASRGWTEEQVTNLVPRVGYMRGAMPPWVGTPEEATLVGGYLSKEATKISGPKRLASLDRAWQNNCAMCHSIDGPRALRQAFTGMQPSEIAETVKGTGDLSDAMPPFSGSPEDAASIANYISKQIAQPAKGGAK